ncbi:sugar phosphate nucleotidyltransferase [Candidatus Pelagibacter sp.]|nr:sugar phosphate nucleotidyltransferase [Candidatus Pelagibacter sp.]
MNSFEKQLIVDLNITIESALRKLRKTSKRCLVVTKDGRLFGTLTDGDLRKVIIKKKSLNTKIKFVCNKKPKFLIENSYNTNDINKLFNNLIDLIPVINEYKKLIKIIYKKKLKKKKKITKNLENEVIIMAGGKGARLQPFTKILPKPLIPVKGKAIILRIVEKFIKNGLKKIHISVNYKSEILKAFFSEIKQKYKINFIYENKPLGSIGSITNIKKKFTKPVIVTNCDVIFNFDYSEMVNFHKINKNSLSLAVSKMNHKIEHGTCKIDKNKNLINIFEKPTINYLINTGFYVLDPKILKLIPKNKFFDVIDLINLLKFNNLKIGAYNISSKNWHDVGNWLEYKKTINQLDF